MTIDDDNFIKLLVQAALHAFHLGKRAKRAKPRFDVKIEVKPKKEPKPMIAVRINDEQKLNVTLNPITPKGKPVKVEKPSWNVQDGDCTLAVADDGMSADVISGDVPGVSHIQVQADADLGEGVDTITEVLEVTVVDPDASSLGVQVGTPVDK